VFAENSPSNIYQQRVRVADVNILYGGVGLDGGMHFGDWGELRMGLEGVTGNVDVNSNTVPVDDGNFQDTRARVRMQIDTLDNPVFPHNGTLAGAQWRAGLPDLGADVAYQQVSLRWVQGIAITGDTAIIPRIQFVTETDAPAPVYVQPSLGGFLQLSGLERDSLRGTNCGLVSLILDHRMSGSNASFTFPLHLGGSIEAGNTWNDDKWFTGSYTLAGSVFVGVDTPIGPSFLAYGQAEGGERSVYFFLGPVLGNNQN
jgi:NTE family protein